MSSSARSTYTVSDYLLNRLKDIGIDHLFGVPGDYVLDFLDKVLVSPVKWVGTCNELNAGYAADGYARMNGAGAAVVTYGVGGLSILNSVAGAFAERVPLIIISGAPPVSRRESGDLMHHLISGYDLQLDIFKKTTVDATLLLNPDTAPAEIDRVLSNAISHKLPVYLELPLDVAQRPCSRPEPFASIVSAVSDPAALADAVALAAYHLNKAEHPLILAGIEIPRFGLAGELLHFVEHAELPFAAMLSSKASLPELHPQFVGVYQGGWSREGIRDQVEKTDCLLAAGVWFTDIDTGMFSTRLDPAQMINASNGEVRIGNTLFEDVQLNDFLNGITDAVTPRSYLLSHPREVQTLKPEFSPEKGRPLTASRMYEQINHFLDDQMVLLAEPGDAFCAAIDFQIEEAENFIVQDYYASIGFCTPAALGVALARPRKRPVVLTGDGAFQMTAQEISTLIRMELPAVILLINNDGYLIERVLHQDGAYNDIAAWNYSKLPDVFGKSDFVRGIVATTEDELAEAFAIAGKDDKRFYFIEMKIPDRSCSSVLRQLGEAYARTQAKK